MDESGSASCCMVVRYRLEDGLGNWTGEPVDEMVWRSSLKEER